MGPAGLSLIRLLQSKKTVAAVLVTAVTLLLIGGILAATTTLGCGPANKVGVKLARCIATNPTAARMTPSPVSTYPAKGNPPPPPSANPVSSYPPYSNPVSNPPYTNPSSGYPPQGIPGSGTADPFYPPSTGQPPAITLNCRLPIYAGQPGSGGFINFPQGNFTADPRSAVALPAPSPGAPSPGPNNPAPGYGGYPGGYGQGYYGMAWEPVHARWLPVKLEWVAPDGNHYAYPSTNSVYLVDAATSTQVELGVGHGWVVIRVLNDRVYATIPNSPGFWVLPFAGTPRQVTVMGYWQAATSVAAYGMKTSAVPQGVANTLVKLDIATGNISDWFTRDGSQTWIYGFDGQANPIVYASYYNGNGDWALWLTKSPTSATVIANRSQNFYTQGPSVADAHGIWFPAYTQQPYANNAGIVLYVAGSGSYWMATVGGQLAGGCV
jgi:hypothetical protein